MTCDRCISLTRELREARELIAEYERPDATVTPEVQRVRKWLGRPTRIQTAKMLMALLKSPGQIVSNDRLAFAMDYDGDAPVTRILSVHSSHLRKSLQNKGLPRSVRTGYGAGRWIDPNNAALITAAIEANCGS